MKIIIKTGLFVIAVSLMIAFASFNGSNDVKAKTKKYNCEYIKGSYGNLLEFTDALCDRGGAKNIKVSSKKKISVKRNPHLFGGIKYGVFVKAKKIGKAKVTIKTKKNKYIYNVRVLSPKKIAKESKKELNKIFKGLKNKKKTAYVDLNGDGIKDLFVRGVIYTYDYKTKEVQKIRLTYDAGIPFNKVSNLYVSKKNQVIYITTYDDELYGSDIYTKFYTGLFYTIEDIRNPEEEESELRVSENKYVALINEPEHFVPKKKYKAGSDYYMIDYDWDDQDDAWYDNYTNKKLKKTLKKMLPGKKKIKLRKKK